jgi:hypothetical protein
LGSKFLLLSPPPPANMSPYEKELPYDRVCTDSVLSNSVKD